jgi:MFS transporter, NNP family, nitrate/nitrite transporter
LLLPLALGSLGLAGSYLVWFFILIAGTALYYRLGRNSWYFQYREQGHDQKKAYELAKTAGQEIFPSGNLLNSLLTSAKVWKTWALVGIYFTTFGGFVALTAWLPTYWSAYLGMSAFMAGALTAFYSITTSLTRVKGGKVADRLGGESTTMLALILTLVGALVISFSRDLSLSIVAVLFLAVGMGAANAAVFKLVPQAVPGAVGGTAGWVGGLGAFGGFVIPPILGAVVRSQGQAGYASGFSVFVVLATLSIILTFVLKQSFAHQAITTKEKAA